MEVIKQSLNTSNVDLSDIEELTDIFDMLGNQQEIKKVYSRLEDYLEELNVGFSIWEVKGANNIKLGHMSDKTISEEDYDWMPSKLRKHVKEKTPVFNDEELKMYSIIPIMSREETIGFFAIHDEVEMGEKWKKIYVVTTLLSFTLHYYNEVEKTKEISIVDAVTGLYNFRHFKILLGIEIDKVERYKQPLTLTIFRIKDMDIINEKLSFSGGEVAIKEFGEILKELGRKTDMPSRIGETTFSVLLYGTNKEGADIFLDRIDKFLSENKIEISGHHVNLEVHSDLLEYKKGMTAETYLQEIQDLLD